MKEPAATYKMLRNSLSPFQTTDHRPISAPLFERPRADAMTFIDVASKLIQSVSGTTDKEISPLQRIKWTTSKAAEVKRLISQLEGVRDNITALLTLIYS